MPCLVFLQPKFNVRFGSQNQPRLAPKADGEWRMNAPVMGGSGKWMGLAVCNQHGPATSITSQPGRYVHWQTSEKGVPG